MPNIMLYIITKHCRISENIYFLVSFTVYFMFEQCFKIQLTHKNYIRTVVSFFTYEIHTVTGEPNTFSLIGYP